MSTPLIADTHVHLHDLYSVPAFLSAAADHFSKLSGQLRMSNPDCVLCFADMPGQDSFARLKNESEGWEITEQERGLRLTRTSDGRMLHALPGHQLVTSESLEVLALGCRSRPSAGTHSLGEVIEHIREAEGIPVLPWGVGKWTGSRAQVLQELSSGQIRVRFADNGNRLRNSPLPASLRYAQDHHRFPLAGSDPLPLKSHEVRAGSYCSVWEPEEEGTALERLNFCLTHPVSVRWAGHLTSPVQFVLDQAVMQRNKHLPWLAK